MIIQSKLKSLKAKDFYLLRDFTPIFIYDWLLDGIPEYSNRSDVFMHKNVLSFMFMSSDIHLILNKVFSKQNTMIDGRYKKSRLYLFETPLLYIVAQAETGDRGTGWCVLEKTNMENPKVNHYTDELLSWSKESLKELSDFMREMSWLLLKYSDNERKEYFFSHKNYLVELQNQFGRFSNEDI